MAIAIKTRELQVTHECCSFSPGEKVRMRAGKKTLRIFASLREAHFDALSTSKKLLAKVLETVIVIASVWITSPFKTWKIFK
jgi:hypothetical protein